MEKGIISYSQLQEMEKLFLKNEDKDFRGKFLQEYFTLNKMGVQDGIRRLRLKGIPIVSKGRSGYSYTKDKEEILKTGISLKKRGEKILHVGNQMILMSMNEKKHY